MTSNLLDTLYEFPTPTTVFLERNGTNLYLSDIENYKLLKVENFQNDATETLSLTGIRTIESLNNETMLAWNILDKKIYEVNLTNKTQKVFADYSSEVLYEGRGDIAVNPVSKEIYICFENEMKLVKFISSSEFSDFNLALYGGGSIVTCNPKYIEFDSNNNIVYGGLGNNSNPAYVLYIE